MSEEHDHEDEHSEEQSVLGLKIAFIFIVFFCTYLSLIPVYSAKCRKNKLSISLMNCFAAGVFLVMSLFHILPEAAYEYSEAMQGHEVHDDHRLLQEEHEEEEAHSDGHGVFPLPYLIYILGYTSILLIEKVLAPHCGHTHSHGGDEDEEEQEQAAKTETESKLRQVKESEGAQRKGGESERPIQQSDDVKISNIEASSAADTGLQIIPVGSHLHQDKSKKEANKEIYFCGFNIAPLVLMFAIAFHGFFEGIAVGLVSNLSTLIPLVIGVVIEEAVADFSFGVQLSKNKNRSKVSILSSITLLSFFQPVGTIIGLALTEAPRLVSSIVISFSGGTFLYIACSEILMNEFKSQQHRYPKIIMFCLGFGILVPLWLLHKH